MARKFTAATGTRLSKYIVSDTLYKRGLCVTHDLCHLLRLQNAPVCSGADIIASVDQELNPNFFFTDILDFV